MPNRPPSFAPTETIETEVFARLPDKYRQPSRATAWSAARQHGTVDCFLEGPSFDRAGNLYCTDIPFGRIFRVSPRGEFELIAEYDGEPNGLKIHRDGRIFIADRKHGLLLLDPDRGAVTPFFPRASGESFRGLNDLWFSARGDCYFTDQGQSGLHDPYGRVYRLRADGQLSCLMRTIPGPNGLAMNPEEDALLVCVTRANAVWRLPLLPSGEVTKVGVFLQLSGGLGGGPDGMAVDEQGNYVIAHAGFGTVWYFSRIGEPLARIRSCAGIGTTNVAFGGPSGRTLYITESETGSILAAPMPVSGLPMYSHQ